MITISQKTRAKHRVKLQLSSTFREWAKHSTMFKKHCLSSNLSQSFFNLPLFGMFFSKHITHLCLRKYSNQDLNTVWVSHHELVLSYWSMPKGSSETRTINTLSASHFLAILASFTLHFRQVNHQLLLNPPHPFRSVGWEASTWTWANSVSSKKGKTASEQAPNWLWDTCIAVSAAQATASAADGKGCRTPDSREVNTTMNTDCSTSFHPC